MMTALWNNERRPPATHMLPSRPQQISPPKTRTTCARPSRRLLVARVHDPFPMHSKCTGQGRRRPAGRCHGAARRRGFFGAVHTKGRHSSRRSLPQRSASPSLRAKGGAEIRTRAPFQGHARAGRPRRRPDGFGKIWHHGHGSVDDDGACRRMGATKGSAPQGGRAASRGDRTLARPRALAAWGRERRGAHRPASGRPCRCIGASRATIERLFCGRGWLGRLFAPPATHGRVCSGWNGRPPSASPSQMVDLSSRFQAAASFGDRAAVLSGPAAVGLPLFWRRRARCEGWSRSNRGPSR